MAGRSLDKKPYGNHKMFSIEDGFLAHVDTKRMNWYLDRDLAVMINDKDFKLTFKSKGDKDRGEYYKLELSNCCVVCGSGNELTKHHVVPYQYRKYFPDEYKSKSSFDVLCLCKTCHNEYELKADVLKDDLLAQFNLESYTKDVQRVSRSIHALENYSEWIEGDRKQRMVSDIEDFFDDSLDNILDGEEIEFESATSLLMKNIKDIEGFIIMWRKHFVEHTNAKSLPQEWLDEMGEVKKFFE
tara:strand:+ start:1597 stop:2322 length:726 start_codon:yes stop_codon:yes gene_type:complete